jgi:hypothetical protein
LQASKRGNSRCAAPLKRTEDAVAGNYSARAASEGQRKLPGRRRLEKSTAARRGLGVMAKLARPVSATAGSPRASAGRAGCQQRRLLTAAAEKIDLVAAERKADNAAPVS